MKDDRGSIAPLILLCFLIAAFMVMGTTAAGSAFLAQRDLQAVCDGAAVRAANAADESGAYSAAPGLAALPLSEASVQAAVDDYRATGYPGDPTLTVTAATDGQRVTVGCHRVVQVPFGAVFGQSAGLQRDAASTARAPLRD
ncbi:MAG: pilus assembly protein TadG-related protein [Actinomycetota bacterium]|nr:pilus assembly protein TadG-related protein [Actinomycetota bacterium]